MINEYQKRHELRGLLFDLDGTLLDSFSAHFEAYRAMFARFNMQISAESFLASYSPNWLHTYQAMGLPSELWATADSYWLEAAEQQKPGLLPGVRETLATLRHSYKLGLVTSGSKERVWRDLNRNQIEAFFDVVITGDDVQKPKPSPESLELALSKLGMKATEVIYIGDTDTDYNTARAARVDFIGIPSAFGSLSSDNTHFKIQAITDLLEVFAG